MKERGSERARAVSLRRRGKSVRDIAQVLGVSKSSVSLWCASIRLSPGQRLVLEKRAHEKRVYALRKAASRKKEAHKARTSDASRTGARDAGILSKRDVYCIGLGLYWGEGYKRGNNEFGFTNSDPRVISFILRWLEISFGVKKTSYIARLSINETHVDNEIALLRFWSNRTTIPLSQFTKTSVVRTPRVRTYDKSRTYYGVLRIKIREGSVLRSRILGAIAKISD